MWYHFLFGYLGEANQLCTQFVKIRTAVTWRVGVGRPRSRPGSNARPLHLGTESRLLLLGFGFFHQLGIHWSPFFLRAPLSKWVWVLACLGRLRFRRGRLVHALAGLCLFPSASAFLFSCLFRVCPLRTLVAKPAWLCVCVLTSIYPCILSVTPSDSIFSFLVSRGVRHDCGTALNEATTIMGHWV